MTPEHIQKFAIMSKMAVGRPQPYLLRVISKLAALREENKDDVLTAAHLDGAILTLSKRPGDSLELAQHHVDASLRLQNTANSHNKDASVLMLITSTLQESNNRFLVPADPVLVPDQNGTIGKRLAYDLAGNEMTALTNMQRARNMRQACEPVPVTA